MKIFFKFYFCFSIYFFGSKEVNAQFSFDKCSQIDTTFATNPTNVECETYTPIIIEGSVENATPDSNLSLCQGNTNPTVWFKISVDDGAVQLGSAVVGVADTLDYVLAFYRGDCDSLIIIPTSHKADSIKCSNDDNFKYFHVVGTIPSINEYYIAVTAKSVVTDPNFILAVWSSSDCVSCIGEHGCEPKANFNVSKRSSLRKLDDPKFIPEEEITVCIDYNYNASSSQHNWLHGMIPDFGPAWDMINFNPSKIQASPSTPKWFEADGTACSPIINEQMPYLCTYYDPITGKLKLCHMECQTCPCTGPLRKGSLLPSGWFWNSTGGPGCENECSPSSYYGIGQVVVDLKICMDLKVKSYEEIKNQNFNKDLQINFQTTSDGVSGCWNDPLAECMLDFAQIGPKWEVDFCPLDSIWLNNKDITVNKDLNKYEWYNCVNDSLVFTSTIPQFTPTQNGSYYCVITGRFCNAKTKCIVYDLISSTTDYTSTFVKIYPNPGQDRVTIELKDDVIKDAQIAAMTDTKGNHWPVVSSRISDNMYSIDTAKMPQGVYVIYILDGNGTKYMVKWIKI